MSDTVHPVTLTVPRGRMALSAMRLVVGWVASCNDLPLDQIDDINLALETLVAGEADHGGPLGLTLSTDNGDLRVTVTGLESRDLLANLEAGEGFAPSSRWPLDVRIFLSALADEYELVERKAASFGVVLKKRMQ